MKGYYTSDGYMGFAGNRYWLFVSEEEYVDYMREMED